MVETIVLISFKKRACQGSKGTIGHAFASKTSWHLHIAGCCICCCNFESKLSGPQYSVSNISLNCPPPDKIKTLISLAWSAADSLHVFGAYVSAQQSFPSRFYGSLSFLTQQNALNVEKGSALCFEECPWREDFNFCMMGETFKSYCISYYLSDKMCSYYELSLWHICKVHWAKGKQQQKRK